MSAMSPWLSIVLLGAAITGYAWMMPKPNRAKESEFSGEAAYNQLIEDLEAENRELFDAVAKFKREQDETVEKLGRRIVDMEHQMKKWSEQSPPAAWSTNSQPPITEAPSVYSNEVPVSSTSVEPTISNISSFPDTLINANETAEIEEDIEIPPTTIRGRYPALLDMHDKGRSVEHIAKALGMNKGEVQLILQLVRREEQ